MINQKWTIQRNWQHRVHKTNKTETQHSMCWTSLCTNNINKTWVLLQTTVNIFGSCLVDVICVCLYIVVPNTFWTYEQHDGCLIRIRTVFPLRAPRFTTCCFGGSCSSSFYFSVLCFYCVCPHDEHQSFGPRQVKLCSD